jgi:hypothetical protein
MKVTVYIPDELIDLIMTGPMPMELDDDATLQERLDFMAEHWGIGLQVFEQCEALSAVRKELYAKLGMEFPGDHSWWPPEKD